jgi:hypothetical protein
MSLRSSVPNAATSHLINPALFTHEVRALVIVAMDYDTKFREIRGVFAQIFNHVIARAIVLA